MKEHRSCERRIQRLEDALAVIVTTPAIKAFLERTDPQALKQAEDALKWDGQIG